MKLAESQARQEACEERAKLSETQIEILKKVLGTEETPSPEQLTVIRHNTDSE